MHKVSWSLGCGVWESKCGLQDFQTEQWEGWSWHLRKWDKTRSSLFGCSKSRKLWDIHIEIPRNRWVYESWTEGRNGPWESSGSHWWLVYDGLWNLKTRWQKQGHVHRMIGKVIKGLSLVTFQVLVVGTVRRNQAEEAGRRGWEWGGIQESTELGGRGMEQQARTECACQMPWVLSKGERWALSLGFSSVIATCDLDRTSFGGMAKQSPTGESSTETTGKELG